MVKKVIAFSLFLFLAACSQLSIITPAPVVSPPEVRGGHLKYGFDGHFGSSEYFEITSNAGRRPPDFSTPSSTLTFIPSLGGLVSLWDQVELGLGLINISGAFFRFQAQLLGERRQSAKTGNTSLSVFGRSFATSASNKGDQSQTFGAGGQNWSAKAQLTGSELGTSVGYRYSESQMVFLGVAKNWHQGKAVIDQSATDTDLGGQYESEFHGQLETVQTGIAIGMKNIVTLTAAYNHSKLMKLSERYWTTFYLHFSIPFGD